MADSAPAAASTFTTRINGAEVTFQADAGTLAADVIRRMAGLTGTKLVCGAGVCGACTILLDGEPVTSCILPAYALDGAEVRTVEGLGADGGLHPVQKAFMVEDGLQCGFCTPGFVVEAVAFYDAWRAAGRRDEPSREEIAAALSGHLCRCGAYPGIYEAVRRACRGDFDGDAPVSAPRVEAEAKVTGRARYTVDVQLPGQLDGVLIRSTEAHAEVEALDLDGVAAVDGVRAVVRLLSESDPFVRYVGQPLAAVAADDYRTAHRAARAVSVTYRRLPASVDLEAALAGRARVYESDAPDAPNSSEGPVPPSRWEDNVRTTRGIGLASVRPGKARAILDRAASGDGELERVSLLCSTADQLHSALEPHAAVARWPARGWLEVWASTQTVAQLRDELAERYELDRSRVRVAAHHIGGGFGAKQGLQVETVAAVELSRAAGGVPVRIFFTRHEELAVGGYRPGTRVEIDLAATRSGELQALRIHSTGSGGVAVNSTISVLSRLFYRGVPKDLHDRDVVTNLPPGKPFRGPFGPPFFLAMESAVDEVAHRIGHDALDLRRRWDDHPGRQALYATASGLDLWRSRGPVAGETGRFRRGVGAAIGGWITTFYAGTVVEVEVSSAGITARTTTQDMGNGSRTVLAEAVAEVLGVPRKAVTVHIGTTDAPRGPGSSASRTTNAVYVAGRKAAREARDALVVAARDAGYAGAQAGEGGIRHAGGTLGWTALARHVGSVTAQGRRGANGPLDLLGRLPTLGLDIHFAPMTTGSLYLAEVVVDTRLGRVIPRRFWAGIAAGKIVAPVLARHQVEGAIVQGIGYTLTEERHVDPVTGTVMNLGLEEFRIPGMAETPEVEIHFHQEGFEKLAGRAAGLSELSTVPVAAALANAVHHATGRRFTHLPLRPARVLEGLA